MCSAECGVRRRRRRRRKKRKEQERNAVTREAIRRRDSLGCSWAHGGVRWVAGERTTDGKQESEREDAGPNRCERVRRRDAGGLQLAHYVHLRLTNATVQADHHVPRGGECDRTVTSSRCSSVININKLTEASFFFIKITES